MDAVRGATANDPQHLRMGQVKSSRNPLPSGATHSRSEHPDPNLLNSNSGDYGIVPNPHQNKKQLYIFKSRSSLGAHIYPILLL